MDPWSALFAFGCDAIAFGVVVKLYSKFNQSIIHIEKAQSLGINPNWSELSEEAKKYVIVQGEVKAWAQPIRSISTPGVTGVIQRLTIREHVLIRNGSGFWADEKNVVREAYNIVRFMVQRGLFQAEILDPLAAEMLDLEKIHEVFEPAPQGFISHVVSFLNGMRQQGVETTEELLKEGSSLTVIGELTNDGFDITISPPSSGSPYFLTTMPVSALVDKLKEQRSTFKWLTLLFGGVGLWMSAVFIHKWWIARQARIKEELKKKDLEMTRKERRRKVRTCEPLNQNACCVVCTINPKEVILLPCGHVCLCEDCSENVNEFCPVCQKEIESKAAAFIA